MSAEPQRSCPTCGNELSGAMEFCPVCLLRKRLAGGVESGESSVSEPQAPTVGAWPGKTALPLKRYVYNPEGLLAWVEFRDALFLKITATGLSRTKSGKRPAREARSYPRRSSQRGGSWIQAIGSAVPLLKLISYWRYRTKFFRFGFTINRAVL
jgi:hypothetical protein